MMNLTNIEIINDNFIMNFLDHNIAIFFRSIKKEIRKWII
jgi:hypothetical protein